MHQGSILGVVAKRDQNPDGKLSPRQAKFCAEYLIDSNGKQSAVRAGYAPKNAEVTASRLLTLPKVQRELAKHREVVQERCLEITTDRVKQELGRIGLIRVGDFYSDDGKMLEPHALPEHAQAAVSSIKLTRVRVHRTMDGVTETEVNEAVVELKTWDKVRALELLGKTYGMFADKTMVSADVSLLAVTRAIEADRKAAREDDAAT